MAEREGFEPPDEDYPSTVFKTAALNRSATSPVSLKPLLAKTFNNTSMRHIYTLFPFVSNFVSTTAFQ